MQSFKNYLTEALKAEDYEAAIVIGWHELNGKEIDLDAAGISKSVYDTLQKTPAALDAGRKIAEKVLAAYPKLKGKKAEQFGRASTKVTAFWSSYGASNPTPKTDILIGDMRFSLKIGIAQLMSAGADESTATFYAAMNNTSKELESSPQFKKVGTILEDFVRASLAPSQLRPLIKSGENEVVNKGEKAHKEIMAEMGKLFEENKQFKIAFAREAMSGFEKFGKDNLAAAEFMLVATADGSSVAIHSVYDDAYCEKIADRMKLQARFKTSSRKLKGKKTGEYNFWSVISLIVDAMEESVEPEGEEYLQEINLRQIATKISAKVSVAWSRIKGFLKQGIIKILAFMGITPSVSVNKRVKF